MARKTARPQPTQQLTLECIRTTCPACGSAMWVNYENYRTVTTLEAVVRLTLKVRRCQEKSCERYHRPYRPEAEGQWVLPGHEFGLDVIAAIGNWRYREHRTVSELHERLREQSVVISERSVTNLLDRYDELVAVALQDSQRLQQLLTKQGRIVLAVDGLQPDVGHEVLWVVRDCLSGEVLLARPLLSAAQDDLAGLLEEVKGALPVAVAGIISDGQQSLRKAVAKVFPEIPHGLCHFHYLREAARPIYEADRHAKKELKKQIRGVRELERKAARRQDETGQVTEGYCQAVRSALTDDGRPPLQAAGLRLHGRVTRIAESLQRASQKGGFPANWSNSRRY